MAIDVSSPFRVGTEVADADIPTSCEWVDMNPYAKWFPCEAVCERTHIQDYEFKLVFNGIHNSAPRDNYIYVRIFLSDGPVEVSTNMGTNTPGWGLVQAIPTVLTQLYVTNNQRRSMNLSRSSASTS